MDDASKKMLEIDEVIQLEVDRLVETLKNTHKLEFKDEKTISYLVAVSFESVINKTLSIHEAIARIGEGEILNSDFAAENIETTVVLVTATALALAGKPLTENNTEADITKAMGISRSIQDVVFNVLDYTSKC